jgi:TatD DNase family protein
MRHRLPPLDTHAHIDPVIPRSDLEALSAVIFAMTRSLAEATAVQARDDPHVLWAVGCHPGVAEAQEAFDGPQFAELLESAAVVGELGLDGTSVVPMPRQREVLQTALRELAARPRIVSLHSHRAHGPLLDEIARTPVSGLILHWWLGSAAQTRRAVELGCYFSINAAMFTRQGALGEIPPDRILTETDHPYGDRKGPSPRFPGHVEPVEAALARRWGIDESEARVRVWQNFFRLLSSTGSARLLPRAIRTHLVALP